MKKGARIVGRHTRTPSVDQARPDWAGYTTDIVIDPQARPVSTVEMMISQIDKDCKRAFKILHMFPTPGDYIALKTSDQTSGGLAAKWIEHFIDKATDYKPWTMERHPLTGELQKVWAKPRMRKMLAPAEISFMDTMFEVMFSLGRGTWDLKLVTYRAENVGWQDLTDMDVESRGERQLRRLHRAALHKLLPVWLAKIHKM